MEVAPWPARTTRRSPNSPRGPSEARVIDEFGASNSKGKNSEEMEAATRCKFRREEEAGGPQNNPQTLAIVRDGQRAPSSPRARPVKCLLSSVAQGLAQCLPLSLWSPASCPAASHTWAARRGQRWEELEMNRRNHQAKRKRRSRSCAANWAGGQLPMGPMHRQFLLTPFWHSRFSHGRC